MFPSTKVEKKKIKLWAYPRSCNSELDHFFNSGKNSLNSELKEMDVKSSGTA